MSHLFRNSGPLSQLQCRGILSFRPECILVSGLCGLSRHLPTQQTRAKEGSSSACWHHIRNPQPRSSSTGAARGHRAGGVRCCSAGSSARRWPGARRTPRGRGIELVAQNRASTIASSWWSLSALGASSTGASTGASSTGCSWPKKGIEPEQVLEPNSEQVVAHRVSMAPLTWVPGEHREVIALCAFFSLAWVNPLLLQR
jgi:hypothetical protein